MSKEIMAVKQQVRLENWAAEVESCTSSGLTVQQWCRENGMSPKTYYYHLRKVRESIIESPPAIVPLNNKAVSSEKIEISEEVIHEVEDKTCPECGTEMTVIGKEYLHEELVYVP